MPRTRTTRNSLRAASAPAALVALVITLAPLASGAPCSGDLDGDGAVGASDLAILLGSWGACAACPADLTGDDLVGAADLAQLLGGWGACPLFDYPAPPADPVAWQIALESLGASGPILPPPSLYDRVERDLMLLIAEFPALANEPHTGAWAPNQVIVKLIAGLPTTEYDCLNAYYRVTDIDHLFGDWYVLTLPGAVNIPALARIYADAPEVEFAEPNGLIGGDNYWIPVVMGADVWRWDIDDGFHDCFDGCDCHRRTIAETSAAGDVTLISYDEYGQPWCPSSK